MIFLNFQIWLSKKWGKLDKKIKKLTTQASKIRYHALTHPLTVLDTRDVKTKLSIRFESTEITGKYKLVEVFQLEALQAS